MRGRSDVDRCDPPERLDVLTCGDTELEEHLLAG